MKISELTRIESQIGFTVGILIGAIAAWVFIMFFTPWEWYFKVFSTIGSIGIIGSLLLALMDIIKVRRNYLDTLKEMEKINTESKEIIKENKEND